MEEAFEELYTSILVMLAYMEEERQGIFTDYCQILAGTSKFSESKYYDDLVQSVEDIFAPFFSEIKIEGIVFEEKKNYLEKKKSLNNIKVETLDYISSVVDCFDELFIRRTLTYQRVLEFYGNLILGNILTDLNYHVKGLDVTLSEESIEEVKMKLKNT